MLHSDLFPEFGLCSWLAAAVQLHPPYRLNGANGERRRFERRQFQARTTSKNSSRWLCCDECYHFRPGQFKARSIALS
jgi:hypothetical protein